MKSFKPERTEIILAYRPRPQFLPFHSRAERFACIVTHRAPFPGAFTSMNPTSALLTVTAKSGRVLMSESVVSPMRWTDSAGKPTISARSRMSVSRGPRSWTSGAPLMAALANFGLMRAPYFETALATVRPGNAHSSRDSLCQRYLNRRARTTPTHVAQTSPSAGYASGRKNPLRVTAWSSPMAR